MKKGKKPIAVESESRTFRKPSWSLDVKIISHVADMLDVAGDYALQLEMGDGNALFPLKATLQEVFMRLGGELEGEGNMLLPKAKADLKEFFKSLNNWERENLKTSIEKQRIDPDDYMKLRVILKYIRNILYSELNRLFVKFITIYSETDKMERYSGGRTKVVKEGEIIA